MTPAIALTIGSVPLPVVMALAVLAGLGYPALTGAWSAQLPDLVAPERLTRAYREDTDLALRLIAAGWTVQRLAP